ncbi:Uncharacterised protein [Bordetella pertussis]|nr:Uncharacterised protein [Bordetella pertussis]
MADHPGVELGHQRQRQRAGGAQRLDDVRLGLLAVRMAAKRRLRHVEDGALVGGGFGTDQHGASRDARHAGAYSNRGSDEASMATPDKVSRPSTMRRNA